MKKLISIITIFALVLSTGIIFSACKKEGAVVRDTAYDTEKIFKAATEELTGASHEMLSYLGMSEDNTYVYLCSTEIIVPDAKPFYSVITIKGDEKEARIDSLVECRTDIAFGNENELDGGWVKQDDMTVTDEVRNALEKASETLAGATYSPVAFIAAQPVQGTNYLLLCEVTPSVKELESESAYSLVVVYKDLQGDCSITDTKDFVKA